MSEQAPRPDVLIQLWHEIAQRDSSASLHLDATVALIEGLTATMSSEVRQSALDRVGRFQRFAEYGSAWMIEQRINDLGWYCTATNAWQFGAPQ